MNNAHNVKLITNNQGNTVLPGSVTNAFAIPLHLWGLLNAVLENSNIIICLCTYMYGGIKLWLMHQYSAHMQQCCINDTCCINTTVHIYVNINA